MKNKKIVCLLLSILLALSIIGCSNGNGGTSYNISGQVIDSFDAGIENVSIYANQNKITQTDSNGKFSKTNIQNSIVLEPAKQGYSFDPEEKHINSARNDIEFIGDHIENDENFNGEIRGHFIDVGQGDSILIEAIEGDSRYKILIDAGQKWDGRDKVVPYLQDLDIETIHIAVGTHAHADHIGGLIKVFENFEVNKVIDPGLVHTTATFEEYLTVIDEKDIEFIEGRAGININLVKDLDFEIIHPADPVSNNLNDESIVGQLRYNQVGFLFTGDIEASGENEIINRGYDIENQILKVAHHGSSTSTTQEFLDAVNSEIAVIQVGEDNRYGHPADEVINRLANTGVEIYRNDYQGDIVVTTDGTNYLVDEESYDPEDREEDTVDKININTADHETLQEITGVGSTIAERIIEYRQTYGNFNTIEEIKEVSGIGDSRFEDMKDEITI